MLSSLYRQLVPRSNQGPRTILAGEKWSRNCGVMSVRTRSTYTTTSTRSRSGEPMSPAFPSLESSSLDTFEHSCFCGFFSHRAPSQLGQKRQCRAHRCLLLTLYEMTSTFTSLTLSVAKRREARFELMILVEFRFHYSRTERNLFFLPSFLTE